MHNVARVCAWWTLAAGAVVIVVRYWKFEHRWFILTGAALLQVALHGLAGVSYLLVGSDRGRGGSDRNCNFVSDPLREPIRANAT